MPKLDPDERELLFDPGVGVIGKSRPWFEAKAQSFGLCMNPGSPLGTSLQFLRELEQQAVTQGVMRFDSPEQGQSWCLQSVGMDYLTKTLHRGHARGLSAGQRYWQYLKAGNPLLTAPAGKRTDARDHSWELVLASVAASFASDVRLSEPDITCMFEGQRVGLAGKVLYTRSERRFLDAIQKGARQLEGSEAEVGFVVINLVEMFPHGRMFRNFRDGRVRVRAGLEIIGAWVDAFLTPYPVPQWSAHLRGMSKLLSVLMFVPTIAHLDGMDAPVPYYRLHSFGIVGREERARPFELALQSAFESVPGFVDLEASPTQN
ncbi:MAG TPA: hypothetical protein VJU61_02570 [Polyangiaceae bacterium]|nr:hypothetical protein [Polyangiaceae bacterium]